MRIICCFAPAKRMWPEGLIASDASDVRENLWHRAHRGDKIPFFVDFVIYVAK